VDAAFAALAETSKRIAPLFPEASKGKSDPESKYLASARIWENKADFESWIAKLNKTVAEYGPRTKSLEDLKTSLAALRENCEGCHEPYRVKKS
jgi:cytochrome c556